MTTPSFASRLVLIGLIGVCGFFRAGAFSQTPAPQSETIAVNLSIEKAQVTIGRSPWAVLTVKNLSNHEMALHAWMYRVQVEGEKKEPPTTEAQRQLTGKLRPGEAALRGDEYVVPMIPPGKSYTQKFKLDYLYDLSVPGKYTVYAEVMDPSTQKSSSPKWLHTNTVQFTMPAASH